MHGAKIKIIYVLGVYWLQTESNLCASVLLSNFVEFNGRNGP
jgi:hypothetical protein